MTARTAEVGAAVAPVVHEDAPGPPAAPPTPAGERRTPGHPEARSGSQSRSTSAADTWPLALRGVGKRWRADLPPVLEGLDLTLEPGTSTWIGGRNGVGKTTLLRVAAGLIEPDAGTVEVWGLTARAHRARYQQLVSFLPAGDRGLYARLTVRRQLQLCARLALVGRADFQAVVERALERFDLRELASRRVDRMSMGQRQRLRIAMTFLPEPEVVLLDEPLTSLDAESAELLARAVVELLARDGALLWCSPSGERLDTDFDARFTLERGRLQPA